MIDAAEQAHSLVDGMDVAHLAGDRQRRDVLLWNFTVLGEGAGQLNAEFKERFPEIAWQLPMRLRNRIVHGYWSIDLGILHTTAETQLVQFADSIALCSRGHRVGWIAPQEHQRRRQIP